MKTSIKRALAVSAIAPFAFVGSIGSAGAATFGSTIEVPVNPFGGDRGTVQNCEHSTFSSLDFQIMTLSQDDDREDIDIVRITADDDDSPADTYNSNGRQVSRVIVSYYKNALGLGKPSYTTSITGSAVSDGRVFVNKSMDNVSWIKVKVNWSEIAYNNNDAWLHCSVELA